MMSDKTSRREILRKCGVTAISGVGGLALAKRSAAVDGPEVVIKAGNAEGDQSYRVIFRGA